jgi:flagellar protein FliJ
MADAKRYARLLRVRTLQRDLAQAAEAQAADQAQRSRQLVNRIAELAADVSPAPGGSSGLDLTAAAGFRARLHLSQADASARQATAEAVLAARREATRAARQDHGALEKLAERARARAAIEEMRKLADAPQPSRPGTRLAGKDE